MSDKRTKRTDKRTENAMKERNAALTPEHRESNRRRVEALAVARAHIVATKQRGGKVDCPLCATEDALAFKVHLNGRRVWGKCLTTGCLSWME